MSLDVSYVQKQVGDVLAEALHETARAHPVDPIDYLAKWLLHYRDVQDGLVTFNNEQNKLTADKKEYLETLQKEKEQIEQQRKEKEELDRQLIEERNKTNEIKPLTENYEEVNDTNADEANENEDNE